MKNSEEEGRNDKHAHDILAKVLVIGDGGVGKTALITRFTEDRFVVSYTATIGVDFKSRVVRCGDRLLKMQIWDTAGQERFKNITQAYYRGATGILLAFSLTDRLSFSNIQKWMSQIEEHAARECARVLVGTKVDVPSQRAVSRQEAEALALRMGVSYIETSAKTGEMASEAFQLLGKLISQASLQKTPNSPADKVRISSKILVDNKERSCRC